MIILYRIFTENINQDWIVSMISRHFPGFSVYAGIGYWEGQGESSLCIEIHGGKEDIKKIKIVCQAIKMHNKQDAVLLQTIPCLGELI